jgi:hypothetical protein
MRYSCKKTAIYKNVRVLYDSAKPTFHFSKTSRAKIHLTRIRLVAAHATLAHATLSNKRTVRLKKRRASYNDRLVSNSRSYSVEKSVRSRVFANKTDKEG